MKSITRRLKESVFCWDFDQHCPLTITVGETSVYILRREARALLRFLIEVFGVETARRICDEVENKGKKEKRECRGCRYLDSGVVDGAGGGTYRCEKHGVIVGARGHWTNETDVPREIDNCYEAKQGRG